MSRDSLPGGPLPVEAELVAEKATALARVTAKFETALDALARSERELASGGQVEPEVRARLRAEAAERLWFLIVQREAIGLRQHENLLRFYAVPAEVRRAMGARRRA